MGLGVELHKPVHLLLPELPGLQRFTELFGFYHVTSPHPGRLVVAVNTGDSDGQGLRQALDVVRPSDSLPWPLLDAFLKKSVLGEEAGHPRLQLWQVQSVISSTLKSK